MSAFSLKGKKGLIVGIANDKSIAWGCARQMQAQGAELAITYLNEKAKPHVEPLAQQVSSPLFLPLNVQHEGELEAVFEAVEKHWGRLDFLLHSIAFAPMPDVQGRLVDSSLQGFLTAMDVSCHSFIRMARLAAPLMSKGGSLMTVSYYGSEKVVEHYNLMGPVKAALEAAVRYLAVELGGQGVRVNALSPGPIATRAASGLAQFEQILREAEIKAPLKHLVGIDDVGHMAAFLASDAARSITGGVHYIDAGYEVVD